ncbi:hypothetical protein M406DRAFT_332045 [Cryphonectria parasitica EP155]|uniref:Uncharacterized protein n=1 Tax=Cryphonectria parasitica (strain ATCC 38755 / EP155) TaxID=660469 RepID=A0A9P4XSH4_CRYP1|nr:uncharacterized protein M406DRAFT_335304 [Cryphonectria parasitica EP155]XP_040774535.1 uncharacterized protein M406DRAFT_332045 [Cryphonectria parasitica EP155]KAF3760109.1 hypothetical protein M406DRAFT_335304 [Cryphonectria parasitica EP155]KAF3763574.1 hypothetical protein M406DRAFT_332045 [Cryphonectria parasitica EP155]
MDIMRGLPAGFSGSMNKFTLNLDLEDEKTLLAAHSSTGPPGTIDQAELSMSAMDQKVEVKVEAKDEVMEEIQIEVKGEASQETCCSRVQDGHPREEENVEVTLV